MERKNKNGSKYSLVSSLFILVGIISIGYAAIPCPTLSLLPVSFSKHTFSKVMLTNIKIGFTTNLDNILGYCCKMWPAEGKSDSQLYRWQFWNN